MILSNRQAFLEAVRQGSAAAAAVGSILDLQFPDGNGLVEMDARDLARLLAAGGAVLRVLKMRHVNLQGDLRPLLDALGRLTGLSSFQAEFCNFSHRIAAVVSGLPALETLNIVGHKGLRWRRPMEVPLINELLQRGNVKDLRLDTLLNFHRQSAQAFFQEMLKSRLQVFWCLHSQFSDAEVALVAAMLEQSTTLTDLRFSVAADVSKMDLIAKALQSNANLTNLGIRLHGSEDPTPSHMTAFLEVLQDRNYTLTDLILARGTQWDADRRRHIPVYSNQETSAVYQKIDFYLALNRSGRGPLLQDTATGEDWLAAIASQWNLSIIFYFCRRNPMLILAGIPPPSATTKAHDQALLLQRCANLFPDALRNQTLTLLGPRQVQDALLCLPDSILPIRDLSVRFVERGRLHPADLAELIRRCRGHPALETILVQGAELEPSAGNVWNRILSDATHLIHLSVRNCICNDLDVTGFIHLLSNLPRLDSLGWTGNQGAPLTFDAINHLLRNRPIQFLALDRVEGSDHQVRHFLDLLATSTSLQVLRCEMHPRGFSTCHSRQLGRAIAGNQSLENLQIHVSGEADLGPLAEALKTNRTLAGLHITGLERLPDLSSFLSVLKTSNSSLKSLMIGKHDLSTGVSGAELGLQGECAEQIGVLLRANIARSRPLPLPKACYNPA